MTTKSITQILIFTCILFLLSCSNPEFISTRLTFDLSGTWKFELDSSEKGINEKWYEKELTDEVKLTRNSG